MALGVLEHLEQHPELDAIGVRLDLAWRWRELVVGPPMLLGFSFRGAVRQLDVRIGDDRLLDVLVHRGAPLLVTTLDLHGHLGPAGELQEICFFSRFRGTFFFVSICTSKSCATVICLERGWL